MNQSQVNNFLKCLLQIDDLNYLALHAHTQNNNNNNNYSSSNSSSTATSRNSDFHNAAYSTLDSTTRHDDHDDHDHDHDYGQGNSANRDLLVAKITAMIVLCCASTLCGAVPFLLDRCFKWTENSTNARSATTVKCLLYFGGGVLLCTTFLHLLPEVQEVVEQLQQCGSLPDLTFALPELLMCAGFFLMYLIEESIHAYIHKHNRLLKSDAGAGAAFERGHSVRNSCLVKGAGGGGTKSVTTTKNCEKTQQHSDHNADSLVALSVQNLISHDLEDQKYDAQAVRANSEFNLQQPDSRHLDQHNEYQHECQHNTHPHPHRHSRGHSHLPVAADNADDIITSSLRGLFIVLALSLHELFEGMAIGLEGSASSVWFMFGAVSAHKLVLAFCVGVELIVARTRIGLAIVYVLTFAIVSPIGIGLGILISHNKDAGSPTVPAAILQGLACGTLLYVVFFEILSKNHSGLGTYFALAIGFAAIFGLQQLGADGHNHSHGSCSPMSNSGRAVGDLVQFSHHSHQHPHQNQNPASLEHKENSFEQQLQILREASQKLIAQHNQIN